MAINFLNTVDLNQNQLNQATIQNLAANPASGVEGQVYFNTVSQTIKVYKEILPATNPKTYEWASISGDITVLTAGTYINIDDADGPVPTINHDLTTRANTPTASSPGYGGYIVAIKAIGTNATGHVTSVDTETYTLPADTIVTYTLPVTAGTVAPGAPTSGKISITAGGTGSGVKSTVEFVGTTGRIDVTSVNQNNGSITIDLTDDVTIVDDLTVGGVITQSQSGETNSFASPINMNTNKLTNVATGTASTDGVNLGQVELLVAGVGVFKGSYNAATNSPALEGSSNIALDQGDYFVVSVAGSFLGEALEPGDFIFANNAIAANSSPAISNYTVVQADDNIAGAGSTDGATQKGVSGFDSANFTVSSNGWVQLKPQANPYAASVLLNSGSDSGGETTFTVDVTSLFGSGALAANCKAEVVTTSGRQTVYPDITGNGTGSLDFKFIPVVSNGTYTALITIV